MDRKLPQKASVKEQLPRSMQPQIPEPRHRVGPKGISSGLSLRRFPDPTLQTIIDICDHYEAKCSGKYVSLASRYVFHMGKEIRAQIDALQQGSMACVSPCGCNNLDDEKGKYVKFLSNRSSNHSAEIDSQQERTASRQSNLSSVTHLDQPYSLENNLEYNIGGTSSFDTSPCCPCGCDGQQLQLMRDRVLKQQDNIDELVVALNSAQEELSNLRGTSSSETTEDVEQLQKGAEVDRATHQTILAELRRQCHESVELAKLEARNANKRAELEIQAMQRRTDEMIVTLFRTFQEEKEDLMKETEEIQKRVARDYYYLRGQLDDKIKCVEKNERRAVQRACTRLKRIHALENLTKQRESILSQIEDFSTEDNNNLNMKLRDCLSSTKHTSVSDGCIAKDRSKDDGVHCLQSQVNDIKVWLNSLTSAIQDPSKISQSKCDALPSKIKSTPDVKIKCKHKSCKPIDDSRYKSTKCIGSMCTSGVLFSRGSAPAQPQKTHQ